MRNIAKIALIVFVSMLEVGYADDCREELYEKYKAHSAEFIKLKNKCKPLLEKVNRLAETYKNTVEYKKYKAVSGQFDRIYEGYNSMEVRNRCKRLPEYLALSKRLEELININLKSQAYEASNQALITRDIEINATCKLFLDGVYDIDKAFEGIARAEHKSHKAYSAYTDSPQYKAYSKISKAEFDAVEKCESLVASKNPYIKAYNEELETAKKALEPLQIAFRNSQEVKEYVAECRGITLPAYRDMKYFDFADDWNWSSYWGVEKQIISYIQSLIANRP